jgi:cell wall-associated NlpC family hydrolase
MKLKSCICTILLLGMGFSASAPESTAQPKNKPGALEAADLIAMPTEPKSAQQLVQAALALSQMKLDYLYGSADPAKGGPDCSGAVYHLLEKIGIKEAPCQSNQMYAWAWKKGLFRAVNGKTRQSFEFGELRPGDLLFWVNTTGQTDRDPPITHVMIYLGREKTSGREIMVGSSDGRPWQGKAAWGVGVFDFVLPAEGSTARLVGYAHLP